MSRLIMYLIIIHMLLVLFDFLGWLSEYVFASSYIPLDES